MLCVSEPCEDEMTFESTYPKDTSSNSDDKLGLSNIDKQPWSPEEGDESPTVTVTVSNFDDADVHIDTVRITSTTNVQSVTVTYITFDGTEVNFLDSYIQVDLNQPHELVISKNIHDWMR